MVLCFGLGRPTVGLETKGGTQTEHLTADFDFSSHRDNLQKNNGTTESVGFFAKVFGGFQSKKVKIRTVKPRKAPIKIEPKVFFSNERTFLAWMHVSIILAGASVAILALADIENIGKQMYGLIMLPVAIAFLLYAMYQCKC